jgi:hypothetical protein
VRILVTYQDEQVIGKVSSRALVLASPVWEKFLFPPWIVEGQEEGVKEIDCTEDNADALLLLLNIAHLNFVAVPNYLKYEPLFQVALLVDQYQCLNLIKPWLES